MPKRRKGQRSLYASESNGQEEANSRRPWHFPRRFLYVSPVYEFIMFKFQKIEIDKYFIIQMFSAIVTFVNFCYNIQSVSLPCINDGVVYLVVSDFVISLCLPKGLLMTSYISCTVFICLAQLMRDAAFCRGDEVVEHHITLLFVLYGCYGYKVHLLVLLLKRFSVTLQSLLMLQGNSSVSIFPIKRLVYFTRHPVYWVDEISGNLLILKVIIEELEKSFLKRRSEILADDNSDKKIYYDENMDTTALFINTKEELQQCREDYEKLNEEFDQYKQHAKQKIQNLERHVNSLETDLPKLQEAKEYLKQMKCCICQDKKSCILLRPCNHLSLCEQCLERINDRKKSCPLCRKTIKETIKVFS